jgi:hypothetical protein
VNGNRVDGVGVNGYSEHEHGVNGVDSNWVGRGRVRGHGTDGVRVNGYGVILCMCCIVEHGEKSINSLQIR